MLNFFEWGYNFYGYCIYREIPREKKLNRYLLIIIDFTRKKAKFIYRLKEIFALCSAAKIAVTIQSVISDCVSHFNAYIFVFVHVLVI